MKKSKYRLKPQKLAFAVLVFTLIIASIYFLYKGIDYLKNKKQAESMLESKLQHMVTVDITEKEFQFAKQFLKQYPDSYYNGYANFITGKYYYENEAYENAISAFNKAIDYYLEEEVKIILFLHLSYTYMLTGDYISSREYAEKVYNSVESGKLKALSSFQLGLCYAGFKIYDRALDFFDITYELSENDNDFQIRALEEKLKILKKVDKSKAEILEKVIKQRYNSEAVSE